MQPFYFITCATVYEELLPHLPEDACIKRLEFGLHLHPDRLRERLQAELDGAPAGHTVVLGYGLCGGGLDGLHVRHNRVVAPRAHDCIALFLGSDQAQREQAAQEVGTYYVTKGWLEAEDHGLMSEYERLVARYGPERGPEIARLAFANYTRLALVDTGNYDVEPCRSLARRLAELYELRFEELPGSPDLVRSLAAGDWDGRFLIFEPGETITLSAFL